MGQGSVACMRYILCAFTLVFVIFGILLLYTGFSTFVSLNHYSLVIHNGPDGAAIVLLVLGLVIFLISFLGCCGAITGNDFMLRTFSFILTLLLLIEIIAVVFVLTFKKTIRQSMETGLDEAIRKYNGTDDNAINKMIDDIQKRFNCCGANGPHDWTNNNQFNTSGLLPKSCCSKEDSNDEEEGPCSMMNPSHHIKGCVDIISDELRNSVSYLGSVVITVIVLQIIGLAFSCMLSGQRRQYSYV